MFDERNITMTCFKFIQSLGFLKKSRNLPSNFPDLEKVWKMVKSRELFFLFYFYLFFKLQATTSAL